MAFPQSLEKLHATLIDARNGYEEAAKDADDPMLAAFFLAMIALHAGDAGEIEGLLRDLDLKPDSSASILSTVHKAAVRLRAAIVGLDSKQLGPFIDGEFRILAEYDEALDACRGRDEIEDVLARQKAALQAKIGDARRVLGEASGS